MISLENEGFFQFGVIFLVTFYLQSDIGEQIIGGEFKLQFLQFVVRTPYIPHIRQFFGDGSLQVNQIFVEDMPHIQQSLSLSVSHILNDLIKYFLSFIIYHLV